MPITEPTRPSTERWKRAPLPAHKGRFVVIAHRGMHTQTPENTLAALRESIQAEVDFVECDLRTTKDGHIVILHDSTVDRTTVGKGKLADLTLAEVKSLAIKNSTERVPTFEELLRESHGKMGFYLDCKAVDPAQAFALVKRYKLTDRVLAYTSTEGALAWKRAAPQVPVMTSPPGDARTPDALTAFLNNWPFELLDGPYDLSAETVAAAKALGTQIWADIQNPLESPAQWEPAIARGLTGLQSDHPDALVAYLKATKRR
nr:glycerophosphodiester phosphodiesterase family protein [Armatimonas sp.]